MTVWKPADTDSTEGTDSPGRQDDFKNRQSIVLKGPRQDQGNSSSPVKKTGGYSRYKRVASVMSSMKKYVVKKVYGTSSTKTKENTPVHQNDSQKEVSTQEAESAGLPSQTTGEKNLRKFANFSDQLKQIRMSEDYL